MLSFYQQLSFAVTNLDTNFSAGGEDFDFSGQPHLALKSRNSEPVDDEHESNKTNHYSKLGSAFVSSNALQAGRGGRGGRGTGTGRGRGL
jgi:hypothetical protein